MLTLFRFLTIFCCIALLNGITAAHAQTASAPLTSFSLYTLDKPLPVLPPDDITQLPWQQHPKNIAHLTPRDGISWVRLEINNHSTQTRSLYIQLAGDEIPSAQAYLLDDNDASHPFHKPVGLDHPFANRPVFYRHSLFPLTLEAESSQTLIVRLKHFYPLKLNPSIWTEAQLETVSSRELVFFGMLYGALSMIVIYNLFIYFSLREKSHLLFLLFGSFTGLFISMQEGHFYQFVATSHIWPKEIFYALVTALMIFCFTFFTVYFLDLSSKSPWLKKIMLLAGSVTALFLILLGVNAQPVILSHYTLLIIAALYIVAIIMALHVWRSGEPSAGFFALAIFLCSLGILLEFSAHLPFIPWDQLNYGYASIGNTAMIMVFAFALADKMRLLQEGRLRASENMRALVEEQAQGKLEAYKEKLHKAQLEQNSNTAQIENRAKSEFLATMSHEIRTPMNSVLGIAELLEDTGLDKKQRHYVRSINNSAKALLNVINDLLDYSKIQSGHMAFETHIFNLEKVLDDCISIFSLMASEAKLSFVGLVEPGTPLQLKGDPDKIRQIILNLLSNAFSFTNDGDIFVRAYTTGKNTVNSTELRFDIISKGITLNEEEQKSLFNPFEGETSKKQHGHELGLTVSRQLVELMQGKIGVDVDNENNNTTLWFTSRLLLPRKNEIKKPLPDRSKLLSGRRIMICDNNADFAYAIKTLAESWGMQSLVVHTSSEASNALLKDPQAYQVLMISEENLTPQVQLSIRQSNVDHNFITSIIVTTRSRFALTPEEMKKQGIQFILEKPYTTKQLYKSLLHSMGIENDLSAKEPPEERRQMKVMVVEDNNINLMVIEGMLNKLKIQPAIAKNGRQALDLYQQQNGEFDVIFMDCEMPEMDGYEATRAIRDLEAENAQNQHALIIGLSAHASHNYKEQALTAGMDDFIVKPVNREYMENLINLIRDGQYNETDNSDEQND